MAISSSPAPQATTPSQSASEQTFRGPFAIMSILFFMWGFMTVFNDILIPRFKAAFELTYLQASLVQFAFFGAYTTGALLYFLISVFTGDPIARMGYKNGAVLGLLLSAAGSAVFWPAASIHSYPLFLLALFIVGVGFAILQIAANPYVTILGPERTASSRLNLAQGFNSIGTTTGPLIGGYLIFYYFNRTGVHGAESVKVPYLWFGIIFLMLAMVFWFLHLPHIGEGKIERGIGALRYPHVVLGMVAIFMYVGGEVSVGSYIISFLKEPNVASMPELEASKYVSLYWGGMLIGRFMGAVELSDMAPRNKQIWLAVFPLAGFLVLWAARGWGVVQMYLPLLVLCWVLFQLGKSLAGRTLLMFSAMVVVLLATAIIAGGRLAMWCVVGVGLFTSIGWSNAFSLAIEGCGIYKSQASSLLVMSVFGGAVLPSLQGRLADVTHNLQISFIVPLIAYAYVAFYGWKGHRVGRGAQTT
jgi:MFS transporter, FHS family, L-fucose permease